MNGTCIKIKTGACSEETGLNWPPVLTPHVRKKVHLLLTETLLCSLPRA